MSSTRPLRRDAERNRVRILEAAAELFAQRGLGVTLNDIAHHAGVGVGTVYRRFPDKNQLVEELFEQRLAEVVEQMEIAAADPDPWHGLTSFFERALELQSKNFALKDLVLSTRSGFERVERIRARLLPLAIGLVDRARASGKLRADFAPTDIPMIQLMLSQLINGSRDVQPELWRRYLAIVIQGLRAEPEPPAPLSEPPLEFDNVDIVMSTAGLTPR